MSNKIIWLILLAISVGVLYYLSKTKKKRGKSRQVKQTQSNDAVGIIYDSLRAVNLTVRVVFGMSQEVIEKVESLIDTLVLIIPRLHDKHPSTEITWVINKISNDHLPGLIEKYCVLGNKERNESTETLLIALEALLKEVDKIEIIITENDKSKFDVEATFLKQKYFG